MKSLKLYEFEGSPFCRRVREVVTLLNLDVGNLSMSERWSKYRQIVKEKGGKKTVSFLIDEKIQVINSMSHKRSFIIYSNTMGKLGKRRKI